MQSSIVSAVEDRPAGGAAIDQVLLATGVVTVLSVALGWLLLAHRSQKITFLDDLVAWLERNPLWGGLRGWASLPLFTAMISLITALFGMYWDISLHIGVGRDEGPLA